VGQSFQLLTALCIGPLLEDSLTEYRMTAMGQVEANSSNWIDCRFVPETGIRLLIVRKKQTLITHVEFSNLLDPISSLIRQRRIDLKLS